MHLYLDSDMAFDGEGRPTTGMGNAAWTNDGADILFEGMLRDDTGAPTAYDPTIFTWSGEPLSGGWDWTEAVAAGAGICSNCEPVELPNGNMAIEMTIARSAVPGLGQSFRLGVGLQYDWNDIAYLPAGSAVEENGEPKHGAVENLLIGAKSGPAPRGADYRRRRFLGLGKGSGERNDRRHGSRRRLLQGGEGCQGLCGRNLREFLCGVRGFGGAARADHAPLSGFRHGLRRRRPSDDGHGQCGVDERRRGHPVRGDGRGRRGRSGGLRSHDLQLDGREPFGRLGLDRAAGRGIGRLLRIETRGAWRTDARPSRWSWCAPRSRIWAVVSGSESGCSTIGTISLTSPPAVRSRRTASSDTGRSRTCSSAADERQGERPPFGSNRSNQLFRPASRRCGAGFFTDYRLR